jgi:hypothetical protein
MRASSSRFGAQATANPTTLESSSMTLCFTSRSMSALTRLSMSAASHDRSTAISSMTRPGTFAGCCARRRQPAS